MNESSRRIVPSSAIAVLPPVSLPRSSVCSIIETEITRCQGSFPWSPGAYVRSLLPSVVSARPKVTRTARCPSWTRNTERDSTKQP